MQMSELIHFLHVGAADADDGGGHFLLTLSDESLTDDKRGPGLNLLYGKPKDLLGHNDEKSYAGTQPPHARCPPTSPSSGTRTSTEKAS